MRLTENMIIARCKESDLGAITRINLWGCDLSDISIVENMTNIEVLALSINNVSTLQPLESCQKLKVLYLRKNKISDLNELKYLQNLPSLRELWLAENPCAIDAGSNYRSLVLKMLPKLTRLDDEEVTKEDVDAAKKLNSDKMNLDSVPQDLPSENQMPKHGLESEQMHRSAECANVVMESSQMSQKPNKLESVQNPGNIPPQPQRELYPPSRREMLQPQQEEQAQPQYASQLPIMPQLVQNAYSYRSGQSLPTTFATQADDQMCQDMHSVSMAQSLNQIPQLKLVVQIHPTHGTVEPSMNVEYPEGSEHNSCDETPRNKYESMSDRPRHARQKHRMGHLEQGSRTSRTRASQGVHDSGWESYSHCNQDIQTPRNSRHFNSVNGSQTERSVNTCDNLTWEDGMQSNRSDSSRASGTTSTLYSQSGRSSRRNANILSALLCVVPELDVNGLQVLEHSIQCRLDELNDE